LLPIPPEHSIDPFTATLPSHRDTVEIPVIWIVLLLSVLVHVAVLFFLPPLRFDVRPAADPEPPLAVELQTRRPAYEAPVSVPRPAFIPPVAPPSAPPRDAAPPPRPAPQPRPPAAVAKPAPTKPPAPPMTPPVPPAPQTESSIAQVEPQSSPPERSEPSRAGDLASYIEARRRARGGGSASPPTQSSPEPTQLDEEARRNQIVAQNLGLGRAPVFGGSREPGGGLFQITNLHYSYAEFLFFGWNKHIRRNTSQRIEVRKGEHKSIELAVVRRMIAIIREHESGDFLWESTRLGRDVTLSARPADNAGLEDFLMREFFGEPQRLGAAEQGRG